MEIRLPSTTFGAAEIVGLVPARDVTDAAACYAVRGALAECGVACLRFDEVLEDGFRAVAQMFGTIKDPVGRTRDGSTMRYDNDMQIIDAGFVLTEEMKQQLGGVSFGGLDDTRPGLFETFHVDDTYTELPAAATVLNAPRSILRT